VNGEPETHADGEGEGGEETHKEDHHDDATKEQPDQHEQHEHGEEQAVVQHQAKGMSLSRRIIFGISQRLSRRKQPRQCRRCDACREEKPKSSRRIIWPGKWRGKQRGAQ